MVVRSGGRRPSTTQWWKAPDPRLVPLNRCLHGPRGPGRLRAILYGRLDGLSGGRDDGRVKVCHVITRLILGGAQENTLLTCEGLHARGHEVTLVTGPALGPEGELMTRARQGGYRAVSYTHLTLPTN